MSYRLFNKPLVFGVLFLFVFGAVISCISVVSKNVDEEVFPSQEAIETLNEKAVTCYIFDKTGNSKHEVVLSTSDFNRFHSMFEELNYKITYYPFSKDTEVLKTEFVDMLDSIGLIPEDSSKDNIISLMNPNIKRRRPLLSLLPSPISNGKGTAFFCNFATWGEGSQFPVIILPRLIPILLVPIPRVIMHWNAVDGVTSCGGLLSGKGFIAVGAQQGTALGFWGIGFSVFLPPIMEFGFIGYALYATATAEMIYPWPPNRPPDISYENPPDGTVDVPLSLSELSFRISDLDGDLMNYSVTTNPYIGSGSGNLVGDGTYAVPVSGLESNSEYSWRVFVTDGEDITEETFTFHTEIEAPIVSDPIPVDGDSWVPVDLSELSFRLEDLQGDPMDYTVETVPNIGSGSGNDVGNGVYTVSISGLENTREYTWFVNVTDGKYWVRKVFNFKTQPILVFNPFDEGWMYRKKITIDHNLVDDDLTDFPVLISLTDGDLRDKAQSDGDDILFMDGTGVANRMLHEIELFDKSSGELVAWVKIPSLSSTFDTDFYMYYGNPDCYSQQYPDKVWDSNFQAVYHLNDVDNVIKDSTSNNKDGFEIGDPSYKQDGVIVKSSIEFDGISDGFNIPNDFGLYQHDFTVECWAKFDKYLHNKDDKQQLMYLHGEIHGHLQWRPVSNAVVWSARYNGEYYWDNVILIENPNDTTNFHYYVATIEHKNTDKGFYDGNLVGSHNNNGIQQYSDENVIGLKLWDQENDHYFDGMMDEVRISNSVRSPGWIKTSYNTMNDPSNFFIIGPEESAP